MVCLLVKVEVPSCHQFLSVFAFLVVSQNQASIAFAIRVKIPNMAAMKREIVSFNVGSLIFAKVKGYSGNIFRTTLFCKFVSKF